MSSTRRPEQLWAAFDFPRHPLAREDGERLRGAFYEAPAQRLLAHSPGELAGVIAQAQQAARAGAWVLGGLRYEAAGALDAALATRASAQPLAEFAIYHQAPQPWPAEADCFTGPLGWADVQADADEAVQIERVREWIRAGDCYQINLTTRLHAALPADLDPARLFLALHAQQPGGFSLFLRSAGVASVSPELFFDWRPLPESQRSWLLAAQPMKGTAPRGNDVVEDEAAQAYLRTSEKERAENLMIVDLLRNDLGRVATLGSVRVPRLFELHALPTVWQMTSTVTAVSRPGLSLAEVFAALFPCGSVTGAPKVRAMQIIRELEPDARGWYCGALGLMQPGGVATFNVPIRTVEWQGERLQCGIGSAITLDSEPAAELAEWRAKTRFLLRAEAPIAALETLRLEQGAYQRLPGHLARLQRTAQHFGLRLSPARVREALQALAAQHGEGCWRVRLTLDAQGAIHAEALAYAPSPLPLRLALAPEPIASLGAAAEFVQHKTTRRELYEACARHKPAAAFDLLLWNTQEELTECSFGNIALQIDGEWLTPARASGLLPGVLREELLAQGRVREARLLKSDLARAQALAFFNSLRGWCPAELITS
ncbi:bifunctional anthranilate synthase component I family protein/class IV aminotransferase [Paucibacter sediminis]|uniref:Bifunctional anthranilate synthase component I family protein/class IV aminotransferase n=1 Tax=Paucibacter sediminis TaxID=3019553 RepID=A0AA95NH09_9BURK|nr:bifunctional anthranilate synthase component I family protein/class IV aminotransferase [Paucibacter sp. S2-9]WIT10711.1 bifunctional anthranilate synthase component I family protein/class IV aminotransferase [Paucibacter sp. S2-9]